MIRWMVGLLIVSCLAPVAVADEPDPRKAVADANRAFAAGEYEAALSGYGQAEVSMPESPEVAYNQAVAHYKLGDYIAARNYFNRALATRDPGLEAHAKYNLGNVAYASALEKMSSLQEAIDLLKQSIGHYRDALELAPQDEDAQANIQMAQLLIKDLLDKLKQQQEQQQQENQNNQDQQDQQQQDQQQQDQEGDQDQQEQDQQQGEQDQQQGDEKQQQGEPDQQEQQEADEEQEQQQAPAREMTRQEAERLLQAVRDKERRRREEKARRRQTRRVPVPRDW